MFMLGGRSLVWSRTSACHADDPGSNLGGRTTLCPLSTFVEENEQKQMKIVELCTP